MASNDDWVDVPIAGQQPSTANGIAPKAHDSEGWEDVPVNPPSPAMGAGEAALRGAGQGLTYGFSDELTAGARALAQHMGSAGGFSDEMTGAARNAWLKAKEQIKSGDADPESFSDLYKKNLGEERAKLEAAKTQHGGAYTAGEIGGALFSPVNKVFAPAEGAGMAANALRSAAGGATMGAGMSEANPAESPTKAYEFGKDVATGAAIGGVTQVGLQGATGAISSLAPTNLKKFAEERAFKAAGGMTKEIREANAQSTLQSTGRELLDKKIVTIGSRLEDIAEAAAKEKELAGQKIGQVISSVDDMVVQAKKMVDSGELGVNLSAAEKTKLKEAIDDKFQFNMQRIGQRIRDELIEPNKNNPLLDNELSKMGKLATSFESKPNVSLQQGTGIKATAGQQTRFASETVPEQFKQQIYGILKTELEDVVEKTGYLEKGIKTGQGNVIGQMNPEAIGSEAGAAYKEAKQSYGNMSRVEDMANKRLGATQSNRAVSLTDYLAGLGGLAHGGTAGAVAAGAANKMARQYGASTMAVGADKMANLMQAMNIAPESFGQYLPGLLKSATQGPQSLALTHYLLMKDPKYQQISRQNGVEP